MVILSRCWVRRLNQRNAPLTVVAFCIAVTRGHVSVFLTGRTSRVQSPRIPGKFSEVLGPVSTVRTEVLFPDLLFPFLELSPLLNGFAADARLLGGRYE